MARIATFHEHADALVESLQYQMDAVRADGNMAYHHLVDADGQLRPFDGDLTAVAVDLMPRQACSSMKAEPAAHACGRQATG